MFLSVVGKYRFASNFANLSRNFATASKVSLSSPASSFLVPVSKSSRVIRRKFCLPAAFAFRRFSSHTATSTCQHSQPVEPANMSPSKISEVSVPPKFERLPKIAAPRHYSIHLKPTLSKFTFEGEESIEIEVMKATDVLHLYSSQIKIKDVSLTLKDKKEELKNLSMKFDDARETVAFKLPKEIQPGSATLHIKFEGVLNDKLKGFYRSSYKNEKGEMDHMATTQFESTFARKAFPCFDEPSFKATFDITLTVPKEKTALSNMNEVSEKDNGDGTKTVQYATTPLMSTYLVAFIVGNFEYVEEYTSDNVRVRIYTLPGKKYQGEFALQVALKALPFFSNFFGIPYGLPKCDLIAIPDFNFGAMENWGLVTYREVYLLLDPAKSTSFGKEHITLVVAHELAHMWFGNLTTMEWWTDLWLKEGYANWMEYYFTNHAFPEFDIFTQFLTGEALRAMSLDGLKNSHPVEVPINDPNEIEDIYDAISYSKSASLIRMLHDYLGDDTFRNGLQNYLKKYSYKNTVTQNLWDCLSETSGKNVCDLMCNWTKKMGFPLVKVHTTADNGKTLLHLSQERFLSDGSKDADHSLWQIPITVASSCKENPMVKFLMTKQSETFVLDKVPITAWIKLNFGFTGFYKVQYSEVMLANLISPVTAKILTPHDRLNIIGDLFSLVRCGKMSTAEYFAMLKHYGHETDYTVWCEIDSGIDVLDNCLQRTDSSKEFRKFCCSLYAGVAKNLGWEPKSGEGHTVGMLRPLVLRRLGKFGDEETIKTARKYFRDYVDNGKDMVPDLRGMVFGIVGTYDGEKAQTELINIFEKSDFSEIQRQCLMAMGRSPSVDLQKNALAYAFTKDKVRLQDSYLVVASLSSTVTGQETIWTYFKENMRKLIEKFGSPNSGLFTEVIKMSTRYHCSDEKATEIEGFFNKPENKDIHKVANRPIEQSLENVLLNVNLLRRDKDVVKKWLAEN